MNSISIEKLVDVELWQGLLETFQVRSAAPDWLIEPTAKPRKLTAKQFHDLALSTEDEREINAIALFMWMQNLRFDEFAFRCVHRIAKSGKFAVIQEAMLYHVGPFDSETEAKEILRDSLTREKRGSVLECILSLFALGEADDILMRLLLERVCDYLVREMEEFDWIRDAKILRGVLPFVQSVKFALPEFCTVLLHYTKKLPKNKSRDFKVCESMGIDYFRQLILAYRLQEHETQWVANERKNVVELLLATLGMRASKWTESEKFLLKDIVGESKTKGFPTINVENLGWAMSQGWIGIFTADLRFSGVAEFLEPYQRVSLIALVANSLEDFDDSKIAMVCEKYPSIMDTLFSKWEKGLVKSYEKVRAFRKYPVFEANFLSGFTNPEAAVSLMEEVKQNRESDEYKLLMEGLRRSKEALQDEKILEEVKVFCLLYCPENLPSAEGDSEDEESYDEDWEEGEDWYDGE